MKKYLVLLSAGLIFSNFAQASNIANTVNVEIMSLHIYGAANPKSISEEGFVADANGKATTQVCDLNITRTQFGVQINLNAGQSGISFRTSVSANTSTQFKFDQLSENLVEASQILMQSDERGSYATREQISLSTKESDENPLLNSVRSVAIRNTMGTSADFINYSFDDSKAVSLTCVFPDAR